jgi:inner membrane protein
MDLYRLTDRSVKYAVLFIILTSPQFGVCEVISRSRVHPVQYLMLGFAMCMFYVLELSLSEHLGFPLAYAIASSAVIVLISMYAKSVFRRGLKNLTVGTGVTLLLCVICTSFSP